MTFQVSMTVKVRDKDNEVTTHTVSVPVSAETAQAAAQQFVHECYSTLHSPPAPAAPKGGGKP